MNNLKNFKEKILLRILVIFLLGINLYLVSAQSYKYTLFKSNNEGFILRYQTPQWGNYNFEISKMSQRSFPIVPQLKFHSTNTKYQFSISSFYGRSVIYSFSKDASRSIIIDLFPPSISSGNSTGSIRFYLYQYADDGGFYPYYAKIYGNIERLIKIYTCEDDEWENNGGTCLGNSGNDPYCFGNSPGFGKVIFDGLLMGPDWGKEAGLTICVRTNQ